MAYLPTLCDGQADVFLPYRGTGQTHPSLSLVPRNEGRYRLLFEELTESGDAAARCEATRRFGSEGQVMSMRMCAEESCLDTVGCDQCAAVYAELFHRMRRYFERSGIRTELTERTLMTWIFEQFDDVQAIRRDIVTTMVNDGSLIPQDVFPSVLSWAVGSDKCLAPPL
jgi:hypothetical protein